MCVRWCVCVTEKDRENGSNRETGAHILTHHTGYFIRSGSVYDIGRVTTRVGVSKGTNETLVLLQKCYEVPEGKRNSNRNCVEGRDGEGGRNVRTGGERG